MNCKDIKSNKSYKVHLKDSAHQAPFIINFGRVTDKDAIDAGYAHVLSTSTPLDNIPNSLVGWQNIDDLEEELDIFEEWPPVSVLVDKLYGICSWDSFKKQLGLERKEQIILSTDGKTPVLNMTINLRKAKRGEDYCERIHNILCAMVNCKYFELNDIHFNGPVDIENYSNIGVYQFDPSVRLIRDSATIALRFGTI